ncbi:MAG: hypothetical protein WAN14_01910 [Candidatus Acidiferrales bacterium]
MSSAWRTVCVIVISVLQALLVWIAIRRIPQEGWAYFVMVLSFIAALAGTEYDILKYGKPVRHALSLWLVATVVTFMRDISRVWNHSPNVDPVSTLFFDALYVFICVIWLLRNPFGPVDSKAASLNFRR